MFSEEVHRPYGKNADLSKHKTRKQDPESVAADVK
jgi:hypothetical protein